MKQKFLPIDKKCHTSTIPKDIWYIIGKYLEDQLFFQPLLDFLPDYCYREYYDENYVGIYADNPEEYYEETHNKSMSYKHEAFKIYTETIHLSWQKKLYYGCEHNLLMLVINSIHKGANPKLREHYALCKALDHGHIEVARYLSIFLNNDIRGRIQSLLARKNIHSAKSCLLLNS